jgi:hypothetical protein
VRIGLAEAARVVLRVLIASLQFLSEVGTLPRGRPRH